MLKQERGSHRALPTDSAWPIVMFPHVGVDLLHMRHVIDCFRVATTELEVDARVRFLLPRVAPRTAGALG